MLSAICWVYICVISGFYRSSNEFHGGYPPIQSLRSKFLRCGIDPDQRVYYNFGLGSLSRCSVTELWDTPPDNSVVRGPRPAGPYSLERCWCTECTTIPAGPRTLGPRRYKSGPNFSPWS
jgi:hypothetical protein